MIGQASENEEFVSFSKIEGDELQRAAQSEALQKYNCILSDQLLAEELQKKENGIIILKQSSEQYGPIKLTVEETNGDFCEIIHNADDEPEALGLEVQSFELSSNH